MSWPSTAGAHLAVYRAAYDTYLELLEQGVAKEVARNVLPVAIYTQFYWTVNARSLMNFVSLRNSEQPQRGDSVATPRRSSTSSPGKWRPLHAAFVANDRRARP